MNWLLLLIPCLSITAMVQLHELYLKWQRRRLVRKASQYIRERYLSHERIDALAGRAFNDYLKFYDTDELSLRIRLYDFRGVPKETNQEALELVYLRKGVLGAKHAAQTTLKDALERVKG